MHTEFKYRKCFPETCKSQNKQTLAMHFVVYGICKSLGKYFLYFKLSVHHDLYLPLSIQTDSH